MRCSKAELLEQVFESRERTKQTTRSMEEPTQTLQAIAQWEQGGSVAWCVLFESLTCVPDNSLAVL